MFFPDLLPSDEQRQSLATVCAKFEGFVQDCIGCLKMAYDLVGEASAKGASYHHATVYLLTRHANSEGEAQGFGARRTRYLFGQRRPDPEGLDGAVR